jgi:hypothetical protein
MDFKDTGKMMEATGHILPVVLEYCYKSEMEMANAE